MARSVSDIQTQLNTELVTAFATIGITIDTTKWSKRNKMRMFLFVVAVCSAYIEQLMDILKASLETTASQSAAASVLWIQNQMSLFQYSSTDPQVLQLVDTVPVYPIVDPTLRIITACSVTSTTSNEVTIKIAKDNPFVALNINEKNAAQGYINLIGSAGIKYTIKSQEADRIYINANIYYQGQYSSVIKDNVIAALNLFLQNLSVTNFDGSVKMTDLDAVIRSVSGVNDVELLNVKGRDIDTAFPGIALITNQYTNQRLWKTIAGYCIGEDTTGYTFNDSLNFIPE